MDARAFGVRLTSFSVVNCAARGTLVFTTETQRGRAATKQSIHGSPHMGIHHRDTKAQRRTEKTFLFKEISVPLCASVSLW